MRSARACPPSFVQHFEHARFGCIVIHAQHRLWLSSSSAAQHSPRGRRLVFRPGAVDEEYATEDLAGRKAVVGGRRAWHSAPTTCAGATIAVGSPSAEVAPRRVPSARNESARCVSACGGLSENGLYVAVPEAPSRTWPTRRGFRRARHGRSRRRVALDVTNRTVACMTPRGHSPRRITAPVLVRLLPLGRRRLATEFHQQLSTSSRCCRTDDAHSTRLVSRALRDHRPSLIDSGRVPMTIEMRIGLPQPRNQRSARPTSVRPISSRNRVGDEMAASTARSWPSGPATPGGAPIQVVPKRAPAGRRASADAMAS